MTAADRQADGDEARPWVAGYAQARDRLADQERRQTLTGLRDEVLVPGVERALLVERLETLALIHWRTPTSGCRCGQVRLGQSWTMHLADAILALPEMRAALDAAEKVRRVEALAKDLQIDARTMWASAEQHDSETDESVGDTYAESAKRIRAALGGDR